MSERPVLRIVRGNADDAEIAAVTAALTAVAANLAEAPQAGPQRLSEWASRSSALRRTTAQQSLRPGSNAWRASALPQ
ncbi:acyl-CoA carboxylase subunit epsilon [Allosaccharopolyspora coralli]|uniref:Acyl-CoA carboxylase subunit epsilon n=1 Tax=Allosaccharopolyspora coralli TaxID=2665642 RepID=A0A5Q3QIQ4_9PSEU|nr:acyl-CoA carboxylase epsilon subunit [Allosaccharopolyspora coralli]QGK71339.1 acyl-CoA carboxylase subunit epsilon [Allosaccharopolyspora coralli]